MKNIVDIMKLTRYNKCIKWDINGVGMEENIKKNISSSFLFRGLLSETFDKLFDNLSLDVKKYSKGDLIYSPENFEKKIGIVVSGKCGVQRIHTDGKRLPLNEITPPSSFGVLAVFSDCAEFPSYVVALCDCTVAFISDRIVKEHLLANPTVALNIINFMTERIGFLNDKISTFSGYNIEQKVANYILSKSKQLCADSFEFNKKKCAESIGAGRASLYRTLDKLVGDDIIYFESKKIYIIDRKGLERISK